MKKNLATAIIAISGMFSQCESSEVSTPNLELEQSARTIIIAKSQISGTIHDAQMGAQTIVEGTHHNELIFTMRVDPDLPFSDSIGGVKNKQILFMASIHAKHVAGTDEKLLIGGRGLFHPGTNEVAFFPDPYAYDHLHLPKVPPVFGNLLIYKVSGQNSSETVPLKWITNARPFFNEIIVLDGDPTSTVDEIVQYQVFVAVDRNEFLGYKWYTTMQFRWYPYSVNRD